MTTHTVLLLDPDRDNRTSTAFLLGIANYKVRSFDDANECLNWFSIFLDSTEDVLSILISGALDKENIGNVLHSLEAMGHFAPVLIVDRKKSKIKKEEFLENIFTRLPLHVCEPSQITTMLGHFMTLKENLKATNRTFRSLFAG